MRDLNVDPNIPFERIYDEILTHHRRINPQNNELPKQDLDSIFMIAEERGRMNNNAGQFNVPQPQINN